MERLPSGDVTANAIHFAIGVMTYTLFLAQRLLTLAAQNHPTHPVAARGGRGDADHAWPSPHPQAGRECAEVSAVPGDATAHRRHLIRLRGALGRG